MQFILDHLEHLPGLLPPETSPYMPSSRSSQHLLPLAIDQLLLVERGYKTELGPWSLATVQTRLAALSKAHEHYIAGHVHAQIGPEHNPLRDARVRGGANKSSGPWPPRGLSCKLFYPPVAMT
jgi:hypothetical protein